MVDCPGNSAIDPLFSLISAVAARSSIMIVDNFLLPRFLILELLCACHWFEYTKAVDVLTCEAKEGAAKKGIYELREILNSDNKVSYKFSAVKGAQGLKDYLEEENFIEDNS